MPRQKFEGHTQPVSDVIHLFDGQRIITCSLDGSLRVWNLESGEQIGDDWQDVESGVHTIALSPDGKNLASGSEDGAVRLWDVDTGNVIDKWTGHKELVTSVCWCSDGCRVVSGSRDGTARQWNVKSGETILTPIKTGHAKVEAVVYSPDTNKFATGGFDESSAAGPGDCSVKVWDAKTGDLITALTGHTATVSCLAWGAELISGSADHWIRTWNTSTWEQIIGLHEHTASVSAIAIHDRILASASHDKTVRFWNLDNNQPISSPLEHADTVSCVSFSAGGQLIATGCHDHNAYAWTIIRETPLQAARRSGILLKDYYVSFKSSSHCVYVQGTESTSCRTVTNN
jgi:WD40 repeat protein